MSIKSVPPSEIESCLNKLWDELQGANKMRASLFNLIIIAQKDEREKYLKLIAQKVIEKFPSRILFVSIANDKDLMETSVSVLTATEGDNAFACDFIEISIGGSFLERIPFLILPHILPDLPIYLLRGDDPNLDKAIILKLESFAKRIIFDSEAACNLPQFAKTILDHHQTLGADIADLNWGRIEDWRALLAGTFHTEERLDVLRSAEVIHIHYNCYETPFYCHTKTQALYLTVWLATQLGWKFHSIAKGDKATEIRFQGRTVHLHPTTMQEIPPGRLISFKVETAKEETINLARHPTNINHIMIEMSTPEVCSIPTNYILDKEVSGLSLVREICHKGTSAHFSQVLKFISELNSEEVR